LTGIRLACLIPSGYVPGGYDFCDGGTDGTGEA